MRGEAIRAAVAKAATNDKPSDEELGLALAEGVDLLLGFFADVSRIAKAADKLADPFGGPGGPITF